MKPSAEALFVANLPFSMTDAQLADMFDPFGIVISFRIARDRATGESKGFGFVELATEKARKKAIAAVSGKVLDGRTIEVRQAKVPPKAPRAKKPAGTGTGNRLTASPVAARAVQNRKVLVEYRKLSERRFRTAS
jgi:RNA recognition motif-containing protein